MITFRAPTERVGGCNFCNRRPPRVWVLQSNTTGIEVRMCEDCVASARVLLKHVPIHLAHREDDHGTP